MNIKLFMMGFAAILAASTLPAAQEIDENALFGDTAITMIDSANLKVASTAVDGVDSANVSFSCGVTAVGEAGFSRRWFSTNDRREIDPGALMLGDLMLDARLPFGMKAFTDGEVYYSPDSNGLSFAVPELFLDANVNHRVYFRAGKQVLQWGRGYFWNPTDMVNVERKTFVQRIGSREGTFGLKTHIPFGTRWNIYSFIDMHKLSSIDSLAYAVRGEGLFGGTEAGLALWGKSGKDPILGFDFSTTLLTVSLTGEMSITSGRNYRVLDVANSPAFKKDPTENPLDTQFFAFRDFGNNPTVRFSVGLMRFFDAFDVDDRVLVVGEFYYNQVGDPGNQLKEYDAAKRFRYIKMSQGKGNPWLDSIGLQADAALQSIEFNSLARYYGAFFVTVNKFIVSDMTLQLNGIMNFNHKCAMLTAGLTYTTLHNFSLGCLVNAVVGPEESEYVFLGNGASVRLTAGVTF